MGCSGLGRHPMYFDACGLSVGAQVLPVVGARVLPVVGARVLPVVGGLVDLQAFLRLRVG